MRLLSTQIDRVKKADFFGVLFDEAPSYADLVSRTKEKGLVKGLNPLFLLANSENDFLVRQLDYRWNRLCSSLYLMHEKMTNLGVAMVDGEVCYFGDREAQNV